MENNNQPPLNQDNNISSNPSTNQEMGGVSQPNPVSNTVPPVQDASLAGSPKPTKSKSWIWIVIVVILAAVLVGVFLYFHHQNKNKVGKYDIPLVKYGISWSPLNVFYPDPASAGTLEWQNQIYEGLVKFNNGLEIKPLLASSWTNPNSTTWIFNLNPNIYYHDGNKVTAQDVVASWKQVSNVPVWSYITSTIKDVTAVNNNTVQITTNQPDILLLNRLSQMYIFDSKAPKGTPAWGLGSGAYTVKPGTTPSTNNMDLVAVNNWHGGHIYTRAINYSYVSSPDQAIKGLQSGQFNLADNLGYQTASETANLAKNYSLFSTPSLAVNTIAFGTTNTKSPVSNILVRKALALALDNSTIVQEGQQTGTPVNQTIPPSVPGYNPNIVTTKHNVSEAEALLKQAGYPNGVTLQLLSTPNVDALNKAIVNQAKAAGITINVVTNTSQTQLTNLIASGSFDMVTLINFTQIIDGSDILASYGATVPYNNTQFTTELNNSINATTDQDHLKNLEAASLTLFNDYAYIPLYQVTSLNASDKNFVFPLNDYDADLNVYFANVYSTHQIN